MASLVKLVLIKSRQSHSELPQSHTLDINGKKIDGERGDESKKSRYF